jgi:hypothetical protein
LVLATSDLGSFSLLRTPLIVEAVRRRHKVVVLTPRAEAFGVATLERAGASVVQVPFARRGYNPLGNYTLTRELTGHLKELQPHTVALCDVHASILVAPAKRAGVPRLVALLPRIPLHEDGLTPTDTVVRTMLDAMTAIVVETAEERRALAQAAWLSNPLTPIFVAPSAAIDARNQPAVALPSLEDGFVFALVTSPDDQAAKQVFAAAAERLSARAPKTKFIVTEDRNNAASASSTIRSAHAVVHASSQHGLNIGLLHALAVGRPIITTDVAASRDTVDERVNGCRVPPGDPIALAEAMASFLKRTDLMPAMARASRLKAERRYDLTEVNRVTLEALGLGDGFAVAA